MDPVQLLNIQISLHNLKIQVPSSRTPEVFLFFFFKCARVSESSISSLFYQSERSCATHHPGPSLMPSPAGGGLFGWAGAWFGGGSFFTQG